MKLYTFSMSTTLRVSNDVRDRASSLAAAEGTSVGDLVSRALEAYERERFWEQTRRALAASPALGDEGWERSVRDGLAVE
jgi:predicted transcriptional regulator